MMEYCLLMNESKLDDGAIGVKVGGDALKSFLEAEASVLVSVFPNHSCEGADAVQQINKFFYLWVSFRDSVSV